VLPTDAPGNIPKPIITPVPATLFAAHRSKGQIQIVVNDQDPVGFDSQHVDQVSHRTAGAVHEGHG
jgi:hypothetical protein